MLSLDLLFKKNIWVVFKLYGFLLPIFFCLLIPYKFEQIARGMNGFIDADNGPGEIIAAIYKEMGFDGIIQKNVSNTLRKTPLLGSIPGMKWAFNKQNKTTDDVELMVFLRPRIIRTTQSAIPGCGSTL